MNTNAPSTSMSHQPQRPINLNIPSTTTSYQHQCYININAPSTLTSHQPQHPINNNILSTPKLYQHQRPINLNVPSINAPSTALLSRKSAAPWLVEGTVMATAQLPEWWRGLLWQQRSSLIGGENCNGNSATLVWYGEDCYGNSAARWLVEMNNAIVLMQPANWWRGMTSG